MKKLSYIFAAIVFMFSLTANAQKCTREMLEQVSNINSTWRPVVGQSLYAVKRGKHDIVVLCLYDTSKSDADPQHDDVQVVFVKAGGEYKLRVVVFSSIDRVLQNIGLLVP